MLILTRRANQSIMIGEDIEVTVTAVTGRVRLGIRAPRQVRVVRGERQGVEETPTEVWQPQPAAAGTSEAKESI